MYYSVDSLKQMPHCSIWLEFIQVLSADSCQ